MADVMVRSAMPDDADGIARVHVRTWQAAYRGIVPNAYLDALDVSTRSQGWRRMLAGDDPEFPGTPAWVAVVDGAVVGFVTTGPSRDERDVGELYAIYVDPEHWDTGAGRGLMEPAVDWLGDRYAQATLWVLEANERARRFYEKCGWRFDGATKDDDRGSFVLREVRYRIGF